MRFSSGLCHSNRKNCLPRPTTQQYCLARKCNQEAVLSGSSPSVSEVMQTSPRICFNMTNSPPSPVVLGNFAKLLSFSRGYAMGAKMNLMRCDFTHFRPQPGNLADLTRGRLGHCPKVGSGSLRSSEECLPLCAKGSVSHDMPNLA